MSEFWPETTPVLVVRVCKTCTFVDKEDICPLCGGETTDQVMPEDVDKRKAVLEVEKILRDARKPGLPAPEAPSPDEKCLCFHDYEQHPLGMRCHYEYPGGSPCQCQGFKPKVQKPTNPQPPPDPGLYDGLE